MKYKMTGAGGLATAFVAGMLMATALGGGIDAAGTKTLGAATHGQEVTLQRVFSPTVTDEDIVLPRKDVRAMKMQVIEQNMSLSDGGAEVLAHLQTLRGRLA
jgi:hypothetical protein